MLTCLITGNFLELSKQVERDGGRERERGWKGETMEGRGCFQRGEDLNEKLKSEER